MDQAESDLIHWRNVVDERDLLVRQAYAAGLTINRINVVSKISRVTIYRILELTGPTEPNTKATRKPSPSKKKRR